MTSKTLLALSMSIWKRSSRASPRPHKIINQSFAVPFVLLYEKSNRRRFRVLENIKKHFKFHFRCCCFFWTFACIGHSSLVTSIVASNNRNEIKVADCNILLLLRVEFTFNICIDVPEPVVGPISETFSPRQTFYWLKPFARNDDRNISQFDSSFNLNKIKIKKAEKKERKNSQKNVSRLNEFCYLLLRATGCFRLYHVIMEWTGSRDVAKLHSPVYHRCLSSSMLPPLLFHSLAPCDNIRPVPTGIKTGLFFVVHLDCVVCLLARSFVRFEAKGDFNDLLPETNSNSSGKMLSDNLFIASLTCMRWGCVARGFHEKK